MTRKDIFQTIIVDNQQQALPPIWERDLAIPLNTGKIVTLSGVRRSGKTYHLLNAINKIKAHGVTAERIVYINFEDERLDLSSSKELDQLLQAYRELYPDISLEKCYFFFDEIQEVAGWEKFVARLYASITKHIFITGSNAKLLSREIATALRGRTITFEIFPLSFSEYVSIRTGSAKRSLNQHTSAGKARLATLFKKFIRQGGFPELIEQNATLREKILQEYFNVMVLRDLVERYHISQTAILKYFCKRVIANSAGEFSVNKIYNELKSQGYQISKDTLYEYANHVENVYLARLVQRYSHSVVKSELAQKKCYVIDTGLGAALDYKLSQDSGRLLETTIALELLKHDKQFTYHRNCFECDFVIMNKGVAREVIQVAKDVSDPETMERELNGLLNACRNFKLKKGILLTSDWSEEIQRGTITITVMPAWQYCLNLTQ